MHDLRANHPETWAELQAGNIAVTKKYITFVSIGADHACEHLNRLINIHSGLVGISNNANARQRFFMIILELFSIHKSSRVSLTWDLTKPESIIDLGRIAVKKEHDVIGNIKAVILKHGNPFAVEGDKLYNVINHAYIPGEYAPTILNSDVTGQKLYEDYVSDRINGDVSLWAPVKKENNKMFIFANKKTAVKLRDKTVDLKKSRTYMAH